MIAAVTKLTGRPTTGWAGQLQADPLSERGCWAGILPWCRSVHCIRPWMS